jgi:transposase
MRGAERQQSTFFSYVVPEQRIPASHPLRRIRALVDQALGALGPQFDALYAAGGRPSIPPEQLLRALLLEVLFTIRSERQLMEQLDYNFLYRWFVGLSLDEPVWDVTVFTKNRQRCWPARWPTRSCRPSSRRPSRRTCSRMNTSRSMAR